MIQMLFSKKKDNAFLFLELGIYKYYLVYRNINSSTLSLSRPFSYYFMLKQLNVHYILL